MMLVALDVDGTILDDMQGLASAFANEISKYGNVKYEEAYRFYYKTGGWSLYDQVTAFVKDKKIVDKIIAKLLVEFNKIRLRSKVFEDVVPFLEKIECRKAIVTGISKRDTVKILEKKDILRLFDSLYTRDNGKKEDIFKTLIKKYDKVIYIGDSVYDSCLADIVKGLEVFIRKNDVLKREDYCKKAKIVKSLLEINI